jgi:N,N'-diacetyllegionaminate synthase
MYNIEVIAELAQGFEGDYQKAKLLIQAAAASGANSAKFQMVYADELATPDYKYYEFFQSLEMGDGDWKSLAEYANELGIELYLDIFGTKSLKLCEFIGVKAIKLHGTDISNVKLLHEVANSSIKKVILGAGGAYLSEIENALRILNCKDIIVFLGFQGYPTPNETNQIVRVQLLASHIKEKYKNGVVGFADHADPESSMRFALVAVAIGAGARAIEKHLTLAKVMKMEDYESALDPDDFHEFIRYVRDCFDALGDSKICEDFNMSESEKAYRSQIRRHAVAAQYLEAGRIIKPTDIVLKRTSADQVITDLSLVYHKTTKQGIQKNSVILPSYLD